MPSNRELDNDPNVYIGVELPIRHGTLGFFNRTKTTLAQAEFNLKNLLNKLSFSHAQYYQDILDQNHIVQLINPLPSFH